MKHLLRTVELLFSTDLGACAWGFLKFLGASHTFQPAAPALIARACFGRRVFCCYFVCLVGASARLIGVSSGNLESLDLQICDEVSRSVMKDLSSEDSEVEVGEGSSFCVSFAF